MFEMMNAMIAMQEQALELQRQQLALATRVMDAGRDAVSAQKQGMAAVDAGTRAWRSWMDLWSPKR